MTTRYQPLHARQRVPGRVLPGRPGTFACLLAFGQAETAKRRHAPFPDLIRPDLCNVCWIALDDPLHWAAWKRAWEHFRKKSRDGDGLGPERSG